MSRVKQFFSKISPKCSCTSHIDLLNTYVGCAENILGSHRADDNKYQGMNKLIKMLSLKMLTDLTDAALSHESCSCQETVPFLYFPSHCPHCGQSIQPIRIEDFSTPQPFNISSEPSLTFPHDRDKLINSLCNIGDSIGNPFQYISLNHIDSGIISPINLFIAGNGFHSILSGIIDKDTILYCQSKFDISDTYGDICFDGKFYRHKKCGHVLISKCSKTSGILYEIGRVLMKYNINLVKG